MLALEIADLPPGGEQNHAALVPIERDDGAAAERRDRLFRMGHPSRGRKRCLVDLRVDRILRLEPARDHLELQRADDADDRLAALALDEEHLHQAFFLELAQPPVELLVPLILEARPAEWFRRK